jgi:hypothetical protein
MSMRRQVAFAVIALGMLPGGIRSQVVPQKPPAPRVVLVELFTSEGCSSCPPADDLLRVLNGTHSVSGDLIVGISEHVTYWNQLGWRDPFSSEIVNERQAAYGERLHNDVYTPQMVINGEQQVLGSDRAAVTRAIARAHHAPAVVHIVSAKTEGDALAITFSATGAERADVFAVVSQDTVSTTVLRGENGGRTLSHVAVATTFAKVSTGGAVTEKTVHLTAPGAPGHKRHLILFAQTPGLGAVLAVDSVPL